MEIIHFNRIDNTTPFISVEVRSDKSVVVDYFENKADFLDAHYIGTTEDKIYKNVTEWLHSSKGFIKYIALAANDEHIRAIGNELKCTEHLLGIISSKLEGDF